MSKTKQKSIEELLEGVLVPEEEQPYSVPENWVWVLFEKVVRNITNGKKQIPQKHYQESGMLPVVDQGQKLISGYTDNLELRFSGELPVIIFGDHTKCIKWVDFDFVQGADGTKILKPLEPIYPKYLYYLLKVVKLPDKGYSRHFKYLKNTPLPIAPLSEQKRIAEKIERLFAKIDEAKRLIEEVKESFELRRMAILKSVFRGELIKFNVSFKKLGSIVTLKSGKSLSEDDLLENGEIPYIKVSDMNSTENKREIVTSNKFIKENEKVSKNLFPKGTVIFPKRGGAIHTNKKRILSTPAMCDLNIMGIICPPTINPYYMYYWMQTIDLGSLDNGSSVPQINNKDIEPLLFPLTSIENQNKVVKLLDSLFEKEEKLIEIIESKLIKLDLMKQSILDKAFRGELGTNDPTEESAIELLKEALKSK